MKRLFAALKIDPDPEFLIKYHELMRDLGHEKIKWVEDHNIHITLKFFGETAEGKLPLIGSVLNKCASESFAVDIRLAGLGVFGSSYAPRVIWAGIEPFDEISALMKNIHHNLHKTGFDSDRQNLVPHLTLGRIKFLRDKQIFNRTIEKFKAMESSPVQIGEVVLFESILHRDGPEYIALQRYPLMKKPLT